MKNINTFLVLAVTILPLLALTPVSISEEIETLPSDAPGGAPPVTSPWRSRDFDLDVEKVWQALIVLLEQDGLSMVEGSERKETFITNLVGFGTEKFGTSVSVPPPKASVNYPYFQFNDMTHGRYGLEGRIRDRGFGSTRVQLRALLEARALDKKQNVWRWVPRVSNGAVEEVYFTRLNLELRPPSSSSPPSQP